MTLLELLNTNFDKIKTSISNLYDLTKTQYLKQLNKAMTSYMELTHVFPKRSDYEDNFQDLSRVQSANDLILDYDGFTLSYKISNVIRFKSDLYTRGSYPMMMTDSKIIPGSVFSSIFNDGIGFWGYYSDYTYSDANFILDLNEISNVNKVYIRTNNEIIVDLYIKEDYNKEWVYVGPSGGLNHVWSFNTKTCVSIKLQANTNLFSVAFVQAGLAAYKTTGTFISTQYEIDNLYNVHCSVDQSKPEGSNIEYYIGVSGQSTDYPIQSNGETIISGGVEWVISNTGILPEHYIDGSLTVRTGYKQWLEVSEYDKVWNDVNIYPDASGILDLGSAGYEVMADVNSIRKIEYGSYTLNVDSDYSVDFSNTYTDDNKLKINLLNNAKISNSNIENLKCLVRVRKPTLVDQKRAYCFLTRDKDIYLQGITIPGVDQKLTIRHAIIKDEKIRDTTQELNIGNAFSLLTVVNSIPTFVLHGKEGINLIEIENGSTQTEIVIANEDYYATRYELINVKDDPKVGEYSIVSYDKQFAIVTGSDITTYDYTATKNNQLITASVGTFDLSDEGRLFVWENGHTDRIVEYISSSSVKTASSDVFTSQKGTVTNDNIWCTYSKELDNKTAVIQFKAIFVSTTGKTSATLKQYKLLNYPK